MNEIARANYLMDRLLKVTDDYMAADVGPGETQAELRARQEADTIRAELMDLGFHGMAMKLGSDRTPEEKRQAVEWWRSDMGLALQEAGESPEALTDPNYQWLTGTGDNRDESLLIKAGIAALVIVLISNLFGGRR